MEQELEQSLADALSHNEHPEPASRGAKARKTRLQTSTPSQRQSVARKAANARWGLKSASSRRRASGTTSAVFGKALAAAESRFAAAIEERAYHANMTAVLDAEIPSLVRTINALKNAQNPQTPPSILPRDAATQLASTMASDLRVPASPARGTTLDVNLADNEDEDQFLKTSDLAGGDWH